MNILVDLSGTDVSYAMHLLFEKRLGHKLYFMRGLDWYSKGYFKYIDEPAIVGQFLEATPTGYYAKHDWHYPTLTYDVFWAMRKRFGACLAILGTQEAGFSKLVAEQIPEAKIIRQIGNPFETIEHTSAQNVILSITPTGPWLNGRGELDQRNWVFAHQEFDTETEFVYKPPIRQNRISSYQGNILSTPVYKELWDAFTVLLPDFDWHLYGTQNTHGSFAIGKELGESFSEASFIWQTKNGEDGGGHLTHNAFATGRPLIVRKNEYGGLMLEMLRDGETCIDITHPGRSYQETADFIRECAKPEKHLAMCQATYQIFRDYCDYASEAKQVKEFMGKLR